VLVGSFNAGAAYLLLGPLSGSMSVASAAAKYAGTGSRAGVGDVDADGHADFLVGAGGDDTAHENAGAAYLFLGPVTGALTSADAAAILLGEAEGDGAGGVGGAGDVDADGYPDILVSAEGNDRGGTSAGAVYLLLGGGM